MSQRGQGSVGARTTARLRVKVVPGSSREAIAGWLGETLKVRVAAPPERGRANAALEALLADALALPPGSVRVVAGRASQRKLLEVQGLREAELEQRLSKLAPRLG